jgi:predicted O-methyltransferase YrrM
MASADSGALKPNAVPFADPSEFTRQGHREAWHAGTRRFMRHFVKPGGVGAEIGVFWAHFAEILADEFRPTKLYLVDPWHRLHGEAYPNWGRYTNFGKLTTQETLDRARDLETRYPGVVEVWVDYGIDFLEGMPDGHFDWIYLDANHVYKDVKADLMAILPKLKPTGIIMGDDYFADPASQHAGVKRAVDEVAAECGFDLVREERNQFVLRPARKVPAQTVTD